MGLLLDDVLVVAGTPVCHIAWFLVEQGGLLLASATAEAARLADESEAADAGLNERGDGAAGVDFALYDATVDAVRDKGEVVDYAFLSALPRPERERGEHLAGYQARLKRWMEDCFIAHNALHFPALLRAASSSLWFEFDSVLRPIRSADGRRATRGLVTATADGSGDSVVALAVPLLFTQRGEKLFQTLNNIAVLHGKLAHLSWRPTYQLTSVEVDAHARVRASPRGGGRLSVVAESVELRLRDGGAADTLVPFLHSCVDLHGLPRLPTAPPQGVGFLDHLPRLEEALFRRVREPLHFMKLVLGLTADFGEPIDVRASCRGVAAVTADAAAALLPTSPSMHRTATFCVVDRVTQRSFAIGLHYTSGEELPSVETTCTQYLDLQHAATVSRRVAYAKGAAQMRRDDDGFLHVEDLRVEVVHGALECMSASFAPPS